METSQTTENSPELEALLQKENRLPLEGSETQIAAMAIPVFNKLIQAHQTAYYEMLPGILSEVLQYELTREKFDETCDLFNNKLEGIRDNQYLGCVRKPNGVITVWKTLHGKAGYETLWRLILSKDGNDENKVKLFGLWFT